VLNHGPRIIVDIYCRVSTDPQEDNTSLDEQEAAGRQYCAEHNLAVGMVHREVFSGYVYREREKLALMRQRYLSGKTQGVVVRTYDRLSRKEVHFGILLEEMEHNHIQLYCIKEVLEDTMIGRMTRLFLGFLAEWEWEKIRERTTTGLINAAKQGKVVTGKKPPYGWRWMLNEKGEKVRIIHHEKQVWVVRWMAIKYARGTSTMEIARQLTARGIPTPEGEEGSKWEPIMIRRILLREQLIGKAHAFAYPHSKAKRPLDPVELPEGTYPAIISVELYLKIQERLQRNKEIDAWTWGELQKLADHIDVIKTAIELATNSNAMESDVRSIEASLKTWRQKTANYLEDLEDTTLRGDSRAVIRRSLDAANQQIEQLETERTQVLLGMIDREREKEAYKEILEWCQTVKESRGELTYQRKRDFLHVLGVVVIAKKDEEGKLDLQLEIELPEIRELIGQTGDIENRDRWLASRECEYPSRSCA
jgi:site-specific DNA recombinase